MPTMRNAAKMPSSNGIMFIRSSRQFVESEAYGLHAGEIVELPSAAIFAASRKRAKYLARREK